ncbi:hypothetical protein CVT26_015594 [Gymnopilus dilepis]|uniref:DDE Tnp4 domain-containing protein n=1 Tax=Gymnopilus dilepis TaxID=231916 RepID=A0A409XYQ0_9AGAR|nr:hypothetical protein CVT26_015594 [Gymnopilus dilepis]
MDAATYLLLQDMEDDAEEDDKELLNAQLSGALLIAGAEAGRELKAEHRRQTRNYLCRPQLPPSSHYGTAWQSLADSRNDRAYITTMGFDVKTFELIIRSGFEERWLAGPIPRNDASTSGLARPGARSLDTWGALGLVLHYLNSTMTEISLQQIFGLIPTTVSRYLRFGLTNLLETLRAMPAARIQWPRADDEFLIYSNIISARHPHLFGAFGSIDGLNLPVQTSEDPDIEDATYNGWLSEHFISSVIVFSPLGVILDVNFNAPGSWHDSRVAQPIYQKLRGNTPDGYYLIADSAFPQGAKDISGRIQAPIKSGKKLRGTEEDIEEHFAYDRELLSYRQTAEWGMRSIQGSFGRLRLPLPTGDTEFRALLLETCFRLHNLRTREIGRNQIQTVYMAEWRRTNDDQRIWLDFENIVFSEQRRIDRVSRFHVFPEYLN